MDVLHNEVLMVMRAAGKPVSAGDVARDMHMKVHDALDVIGFLVRHGGARRHHCDDAVMRYSAVPRAAPRLRRPASAPKADAVLAAIDAGHRRARDIGAVCGLDSTYTSVVLHRLAAKGLVRGTGPTWRTEWRRVRTDDNALPPHLARAVHEPAPDDDNALPPCIGERLRDTVYDIHRRASGIED